MPRNQALSKKLTEQYSRRDRAQNAIDSIVQYCCFEDLSEEQLTALERFAESLENAPEVKA